uniref:Uncharacterized protein n=2 Tax=Brassica campestris TaxID=3711 RepID=M4F306_BRACM
MVGRSTAGLTSFARIIERAMTIVEESGGRHLLGDPLEESDAALNQSLWGASSSAEHHQQQQQQGMSSYQANIPS